jgi:iron complex transport system substrate-binding protein
MKKIFLKIGPICLATVLWLTFLAGCSNTALPTASSTVTITDQLGRNVTVPANPQRIVSLAPSNTEILYALGLEDKIVGVTDYCNYPPEAKEKPSIGGFSTPNIEEVVAKNPDLVLAANIHIPKVVPQLEARGLTVVVFNPKNTEQILTAITLAGKATGKEKEAEALNSDMEQRIKAVTDKTGLSSLRPTTCFIVWHDPLMIAGAGTFHDELIEKAGGFNIGHSLTGYSKDFSLENLVIANLDVIIAGIGMGTGEDKPLQFILTESRLKDTPARQNNRVYAIDQDLVGRAGPRIVDALEQFAKYIHPELFK